MSARKRTSSPMDRRRFLKDSGAWFDRMCVGWHGANASDL